MNEEVVRTIRKFLVLVLRNTGALSDKKGVSLAVEFKLFTCRKNKGHSLSHFSKNVIYLL